MRILHQTLGSRHPPIHTSENTLVTSSNSRLAGATSVGFSMGLQLDYYEADDALCRSF